MTLILINVLVIMSLKNLLDEVDYGRITPSDFTVMISNIRKDFKDSDELINQDLEMVNNKFLIINFKINLVWYKAFIS